MKLMKKSLAVMLALSMALMAGCGSDNGKENSKADETVTGDTTAETKEEAAEAEKTSSYHSKNGDVFVLTLFQNPKTLDIQKTNADYFIPLQIYDRLVDVEVDENGNTKIVPSLAESWEISEDGLTYTFHLRDDVTFHNGEKFKADDVLFTIDKAVNPEEGCVNAVHFAEIKGYQDRLDGKTDQIEGVKVIDDQTVEITLDRPSPSFLATMTGAPASIYNRKAVEEGKDKFGFDPEYTVGTGYMKFQDWTQDKEINLVKNEDYFRGPAKVGGVRYLMNIDDATARMMFENGELDYISLDPSSLEHYQNDEFWKDYVNGYLAPGMDYMLFNQNDEFMQDPKIRQAVQHAINRDIMNSTFYNNEAILINGILPPAIPGYRDDQEPIEYDLEEAKALLREAGHENDVKLTLLQNGESEYTHSMNEMIQAMLAEAGIEVEIKNMDMTSFWDTVAKGEGFSMYLGPVTADVPDPGAFFTTYTVENSKSNGYNVKDEELSDRILAANSIMDPEERIRALQELEPVMVQEQALYLPIASKQRHYMISPRVQNFELGWQGWVCCATRKLELDPSYNQ